MSECERARGIQHLSITSPRATVRTRCCCVPTANWHPPRAGGAEISPPLPPPTAPSRKAGVGCEQYRVRGRERVPGRLGRLSDRAARVQLLSTGAVKNAQYTLHWRHSSHCNGETALASPRCLGALAPGAVLGALHFRQPTPLNMSVGRPHREERAVAAAVTPENTVVTTAVGWLIKLPQCFLFVRTPLHLAPSGVGSPKP